MKDKYHCHHKLIELFVIFFGFSILDKSCGLIDGIWPFAISIPNICFVCLCCYLTRLSRNKCHKQFVPPWLWNLGKKRKREALSYCLHSFKTRPTEPKVHVRACFHAVNKHMKRLHKMQFGIHIIFKSNRLNIFFRNVVNRINIWSLLY